MSDGIGLYGLNDLRLEEILRNGPLGRREVAQLTNKRLNELGMCL